LGDSTVLAAVLTLVIGLVAGVIGGLAGIGGSIIMLPALGVFFGYQDATKSEHHLYMAAAMVVNSVVAVFSTRKHRKAGAIEPRLTTRLCPPMFAGILGGVLLSNVMEGGTLKLALVGFLWLYCAYAIITTVRKLPEPHEGEMRAGWGVIGTIGGGTGVLAGLLGIGGGIVMVPLMIVGAKVPVRKAVAASAWVMQITAPAGAIVKLATLDEHGQEWSEALWIAIPMAAGAMVGATIGAGLTHSLKLPVLRIAIAVVLAGASFKLAGFF
tara:strand:- start:386 stop:1192 length:807 start_codon:yes stop_codon:yes gene_type:complete